MRRLLWLLLFLLSALSLPSQEFLEGVLWIAIDPVDPIEIEQVPLDDYALAVSMKEEVLEYFSGMIYGYRFRYVPWDIARGIDEELEVELLGRINPTDSGLRVMESWVDRELNRFYGRFRYYLSEGSRSWYLSWAKSTHRPLGGIGVSDPGGREDMRDESFARAIRNGVREYLRQLEYNKPREITGLLSLKEFPLLQMEAGRFRARVNFHFQEKEVRGMFRDRAF
jgi:hypothetical protein